jgi:hypothetical protein
MVYIVKTYGLKHLNQWFIPTKGTRLNFYAAPNIGKNIGKNIEMWGSYMSFDTCMSRFLMHFVPFLRRGILGAVGFVTL